MNFQTKNTLKNLYHIFKITFILLIKNNKTLFFYLYCHHQSTELSHSNNLKKNIKKMFESMVKVDFQRIFLLKIHNFF